MIKSFVAAVAVTILSQAIMPSAVRAADAWGCSMEKCIAYCTKVAGKRCSAYCDKRMLEKQAAKICK